MPASSELDHSLAHHIVDDFLDRTAGDVAVPDFAAYQELLHESGVVEAVAAIVRDHPASRALSETYSHLYLVQGSAKIYATVCGIDAEAPIRLLSHENHRGIECYRFIGRMPAGGDSAQRHGFSFDETYYSRTLAGRPSSAENLTKLARVTRTTFERFVKLVRA